MEITQSTPPPFTLPAVSVIIPMYNAEKYVGECLESILAQTFQDFEVIVVDDCSTDNSVAIVESYIPKFGGRLKLEGMKKNSDWSSLPRNMGIEFSRGEYIFFMDNDDLITPTALEEMYRLAKQYDADVVHSKIPFYSIEDFQKYAWANAKINMKPMLLTEDFGQRAVDFSKRWLAWNVWLQLIRRDFLLENQIKFVSIYGEDMLFIICEICCAKRYVVVPNLIYFHRRHEDSLTMQKLNLQKRFHRRIGALKYGISYLDEFLSTYETFAQRPDLKYVMFDMFFQQMLGDLEEIYTGIPAYVFDEDLRKEFDDNTVLTAFVFSAMNIYRLRLMQAQQRIAELENELKGKEG